MALVAISSTLARDPLKNNWFALLAWRDPSLSNSLNRITLSNICFAVLHIQIKCFAVV